MFSPKRLQLLRLYLSGSGWQWKMGHSRRFQEIESLPLKQSGKKEKAAYCRFESDA